MRIGQVSLPIPSPDPQASTPQALSPPRFKNSHSPSDAARQKALGDGRPGQGARVAAVRVGRGHGDAPAAADAAAAEVDAPSASRAAAIFFRSRVAGWRGQSVRVYTLMRAVRGGGEA